MAKPSPVGVWAKIARAKAHRDALEKTISRALREANHPTIGIKFDPNTRQSVLYVSKMHDFGPLLQECALISGDLLNNLRSALDHLIYQIAVKCTHDNVKRKIQFPICDFRRCYRGQGFRDKARKKGNLGEVRGYWARLERLQPYSRRKRDPNRALAILRDLNNRDKHRLLVPSIVAPKGYEIGLNWLTFEMLSSISGSGRVGAAEALRIRLSGVPIELGTELYHFMARPQQQGIEMKMIGKITPTVSLGEDRSAIALCTRLIEQVIRTVDLFEDVFE